MSEDKSKTVTPEKGEKKEPIVKVNRDRYQTTRTAAGSKSLHSGDEVALTLDGLNVEDLYKISDKILGEDFRERYAKLNVGMQRMNLGNRIRAKVKAIDAENEKLKGDGKQPGKSGVEQLKAAAAPFVKARDERIKAEAEAKAKKQKEREEAAKKKADAKAKKETSKKEEGKPTKAA